ncbi:MAG: hypothetical protein V5A45_06290 [Haloarculaceae archaeon]
MTFQSGRAVIVTYITGKDSGETASNSCIMPTVDHSGWNRIYAALARGERRELLRYLHDVPVAKIEDVVQKLLERENVSTQNKSDAMRLRLHHVHLPKLAEAGLLTWDSQQNQVTLTTLGSQLSAELIDPSLVSSPTAGDRKKALD